VADLKVDIATVFSGKKAFQDAAKATLGLNNQVKTLAKSYVGLFTAQRLARSGFNAAKAFAQDDKAARVLTQSLDNLGLAFADPSVKTFIADLEKQFGVLDDQLRPAFQRLLTTTGSVTEAQSLLRTALDLSAASGADVVTVAGDLSKGFVGQTRALAKYGIGLTQAELKAMTFEEVQTKINDLFGGQATVSVDTYAGALQRLSVAGANAQEVIGGGLLDALAALGGGGEGGLTNTLSLIEKTSTALATFVRRFGVGVGQLAALARGDLQAFRAIGETEMNRGRDMSGITPAIRAELTKAAAEKAANKNRTALLKTTKAQTKAIKEQTALQKAGTLFDIQQAGIIAALKSKITDEERTRLELQLAILTGNTSEASKLAGELAKSQGLSKELAAYLADLPNAKNPFSAWKSYLDAIEAQVRRIGNTPSGAQNFMGQSITPSQILSDPSEYADIVLRDAERAAAMAEAVLKSLGIDSPNTTSGATAPTVNVTVTLDGQEMAGAVTKVQTNNYLSNKIIQLERLESQFR
jgi:hypothetical protein